jgi:hypothetical protein
MLGFCLAALNGPAEMYRKVRNALKLEKARDVPRLAPLA